MRERLGILGVAATVAAVTLTVAGFATAAVGDLEPGGCITGEAETGGGGTSACAGLIPSGTNGDDSGLNGPEVVVVSRDGESVYVSGAQDDAIAHFRRNRTGKLTDHDCITGDSDAGPGGSGACRAIPDASPGGSDSGLDDVRGLAISKDGKFLYASAADDAALVRFKRNRRSGKLTFLNCITGATESGPGGSGACRNTPDAQASAVDSGLDSLKSLVLSPDGKSLYAGAADDAAVVRFGVNRRNGKPTFKNCITGDTGAGPAGTGACRKIPDAQALSGTGQGSGLADLRNFAISTDGKSLYTVSADDDAVARFKRNRRTGKLTYAGCLSGNSDVGPGGTGACRLTLDAQPTGEGSGLVDQRNLALSRDGRWLYTTSRFDHSVSRFKRNKRTGKLTFKNCITGETETGPTGTGACAQIADAEPGGEDSGLERPEGIALSGDGRSLYVTVAGDAGVARFKRSPRTGKVTFRRCLSGDTDLGAAGTGACTLVPSHQADGENSGLDFPQGLALSGDGKSLYVAAGSDDAVFRFKRER